MNRQYKSYFNKMSYGELNIYLEPKLARSYHVVDIDIDKEPVHVYSEITSEPELTPPQKTKKQNVQVRTEPLVHMRTKSQTGRSKNSPKRRSEPGNDFGDKEKENHKSSSRISWHQETDARQVRVFEEINCSDGRHSKILYELESRNGLTRSRKS